jgi:hypothetical protein
MSKWRRTNRTIPKISFRSVVWHAKIARVNLTVVELAGDCAGNLSRTLPCDDYVRGEPCCRGSGYSGSIKALPFEMPATPGRLVPVNLRIRLSPIVRQLP